MKYKAILFLGVFFPFMLISQNVKIVESENDIPTSIALFDDGSMVLTGYSKSSIDEPSDQVFCVKLDPYGNILWKKFFGGIYGDRPYDIMINQMQEIIITGETWLGFGSVWGRENIFVIKLDAEGNLVQEQFYYRGHRDMGLKIKPATSGYILNGFTKSAEDDYGEVLVTKINDELELEWQKVLGELKSVDYGMDIIEVSDGYMVLGNIGGFFNSNQVDFTTPHSDIYLAKLSKDGNLLWEKKFGGPGHDMVEAGIVVNGYIYMVGSTQTNSQGSFDMLLMKVNFNGDSIFSKTFGGTAYDMARSFCTDGEQLFIGGVTKKENSDFASANYIVSCDLDGNIRWERVVESSGSDKLKDMVYSNQAEELKILSNTFSETTASDFWIYSLNKEGEFSNIYQLSKKDILVYPNPVSHNSIIEIPEYKSSFYSLKVYNDMSQLVFVENRLSDVYYPIGSVIYTPGFYIFEINTSSGKRYNGKFIVY